MNAWFNEIDRATTEAELDRMRAIIVPSCIRGISPPLPLECREMVIESDSDIPRLREKLAKGYAGVRSHAAEVESCAIW